MLAYVGVLRLQRWCRQNSHVACSKKKWRITACMRRNILNRLIYSRVLQTAQFYLFRWLFWRTSSTLKIAYSSPPQQSDRASLSARRTLLSLISSNVVCATSKASDQPAHTHSLIRAFLSRLRIL